MGYSRDSDGRFMYILVIFNNFVVEGKGDWSRCTAYVTPPRVPVYQAVDRTRRSITLSTREVVHGSPS